MGTFAVLGYQSPDPWKYPRQEKDVVDLEVGGGGFAWIMALKPTVNLPFLKLVLNGINKSCGNSATSSSTHYSCTSWCLYHQGLRTLCAHT